MSMPFYVSPEQLMKDRADFARKGIARGRSVVAVQYADGILFASENPSQALHKVSEIYDRIAFAAVGRYNEFENLRIAGVRLADMRGYAYDRRDVTGRGLANAYAQTLGTIFSSGGEKPYEVEIFVAEVGDAAADDQIYRLTYDGQVADEHGYAVMGGAADVVAGYLERALRRGRVPRRGAHAGRRRAGPLGQRARRADDRVIPVDGPRGRRARPHPHPAAQVRRHRPVPARGAARRPRPDHPDAAARGRSPSTRPARPPSDADPGRPDGPDRPGRAATYRRSRTRCPACHRSRRPRPDASEDDRPAVDRSIRPRLGARRPQAAVTAEPRRRIGSSRGLRLVDAAHPARLRVRDQLRRAGRCPQVAEERRLSERS